ncbi:MAG: hypothetical protein J6M30_09980 [Bacteroidales bacterium]|nr:hypothetical protein [Bacteroidales bacterium]MBP3254817.1 hypothetical protein [Bacteroidales bacterium]
MNSFKRILMLTKRNIAVPLAIPYEGVFGKRAYQTSATKTALWLPLFALFMGVINFSPLGYNNRIESGILYGLALAIMYPFVLMREYCKQRNRQTALLLPADNWEKFASIAMISLVIVPVYCIVSGGLCFYAGMILGSALSGVGFQTSYDWSSAWALLQPSGISVLLMAVSLGLFLSLMIKNEVVQAVTAFLVLAVFTMLFAGINAVMHAGRLQWFTGNWAVYLVYPLITLGLLAGAYVKLKKERA